MFHSHCTFHCLTENYYYYFIIYYILLPLLFVMQGLTEVMREYALCPPWLVQLQRQVFVIVILFSYNATVARAGA